MIYPPKPLSTGSNQASWLNLLNRYARQHKTNLGYGTRQMITTRGISSTTAPNVISSAISIATFQIQTIEDDSLTCKTWDGETVGTDDVIIAKPWTLRRYVYEALSGGTTTYTYVNEQRRTVTEGGITETQDITKAYVEEEMIVAVNLTTVKPAAGGNARETWTWLDLNMDGRDWARTA